MAKLTMEMQRVVREQRLGYVATVCPDGTPNLSPKGTLTVWDDDHLIFADIRSPRSVANLRAHPAIEVNVVDPLVRKGYRFKGRAVVVTSEDPAFEEYVAFYRHAGVTSAIRSVVVIAVERALPVVSPAYDSGATEDEIRDRWRHYFAGLNETSAQDG